MKVDMKRTIPTREDLKDISKISFGVDMNDYQALEARMYAC